MNKVCLVGRLTRDPELRYTTNNKAVGSFSLAVNRPFSGQNGERETDFINIVVWGKQAENVKNFIGQGSQVAIEGRIQTRTYDDQNGQKRYVFEVVADNVQFLESKSSREQRSSAPSQNNYQPEATPYNFESSAPTSNLSDNPFKDFGSEIKIEEDELPF